MSPPRALVWVCGLVMLAGVGMSLAGAVATSVTADEPYHVQRFNNWVEHGWYIADFQEVDGAPSSQTSDHYVYGPATTLLLHGWNRILGTDGPTFASTSADAYRTRHLGIVLISLIGVTATAALGRILLRSWGWSVVAATTLVAIPLWTGHAMFNVKDPSVATGYTVFSLGLALAMRAERGSWGPRLGAASALAAGVGLMLGTRPGMWPAVALGLVVVAVGLALCRLSGLRWRAAEIASGLLVALLVCWAIYPNVFGAPGTALVESVRGSSNYNSGVRDQMWLIDRVGIYVPTLIGLFACVGAVVVLVRTWRSRTRLDRQHLRWGIVGAQLLAFPVAAVLFSTPLDDDLRQLLFCLPSLALVFAAGARFVIERSRAATAARHVVVAVVGMAIALPAIDSSTLFPYIYLYSTPVTSMGASDPLANRDNWFAGARQLLPAITTDERLVCWPIVRDGVAEPRTATSAGDLVDCRTSSSSPVAMYLTQEQRQSQEGTTFLAISADKAVPDNCVRVESVQRWFQFREITTLSLWRCATATSS